MTQSKSLERVGQSASRVGLKKTRIGSVLDHSIQVRQMHTPRVVRFGGTAGKCTHLVAVLVVL
jgi:hypothetical protein